MTHPDLELLLSDLDQTSSEVRAHVAQCPTCRDNLATAARARAAGQLLAHQPDRMSLATPPSQVWEAIRREVATETASATSPPATPSRRSWRWVAAAVVVGAVLGSGVTWAVSRDGDSAPVSGATSDLVPLGQHRTRGTISLAGKGPGARLSLDVSDVDPGSGFVEVWLLDARTGGMVALGVLDGDRGSWAVPDGLNLRSYDQVDVSREPYDGNPSHSKVSLARGRLP